MRKMVGLIELICLTGYILHALLFSVHIAFRWNQYIFCSHINWGLQTTWENYWLYAYYLKVLTFSLVFNRIGFFFLFKHLFWDLLLPCPHVPLFSQLTGSFEAFPLIHILTNQKLNSLTTKEIVRHKPNWFLAQSKKTHNFYRFSCFLISMFRIATLILLVCRVGARCGGVFPMWGIPKGPLTHQERLW